MNFETLGIICITILYSIRKHYEKNADVVSMISILKQLANGSFSVLQSLTIVWKKCFNMRFIVNISIYIIKASV